MKHFFSSLSLTVVVMFATGYVDAAVNMSNEWKLGHVIPPVLAISKNFAIPCQENNSTIKVNDALDILNSLISKEKTQDPICLNASLLNLETRESIDLIKDKIDHLLDMEKSAKTSADSKRWIVIIINSALYLAKTLNDTTLVKHLQDMANFTLVMDEWLNSSKDLLLKFEITCSKETIDLGALFPQNRTDKWSDYCWPAQTCINPLSLKSVTHISLELIHDKLQSLINEEADKLHVYQKTFSLMAMLQINNMGQYLSMLGYNPWAKNKSTMSHDTESSHSSHTSHSH